MTNYREKTTERDRKRPLLLVVGMLFACGLTLLSFEYRVERRISEEVILPARPAEEIPVQVPIPLSPEPKVRIKQVKAPVLPPDIIRITQESLPEADPEPDTDPKNGYNYGDIDIDGIDEDLPPEDLSPAEYYERPQFTATFADCGGVKDPEERFACTQQKLAEYIASRVTFPYYLSERGVGGIVDVSFVIGADGSVKDVEVLSGVHSELDSQVVNALRNMKPWTPARQGEHIVNQKFRTTVNFQR
ncbi:MAG: energy transducer TonB [Flavobacteriales bacterium]